MGSQLTSRDLERPDDPTIGMDEAIAPPRKNGELVFEAPWESRAFGMAVTLYRDTRFEWGEFAAALATTSSSAGYYARWLTALETILLSKGMLMSPELETRSGEYASGQHDHTH